MLDTMAERIKKRRKVVGLTQKELADKTGFSLITVKRWEDSDPQKGRIPNAAVVPKIAKALETSVDYLMEVGEFESDSNVQNVVGESGRDFSIDSKAGRLFFRDGERIVDLPDTPENQDLYWRVVEKMLSNSPSLALAN